MAATIFELTNIVKREEGIESLKASVKKKFFKKGEAVIKANNDAIDAVRSHLIEIKVEEPKMFIEEEKEYKGIIDAINHRKGDDLPVSAFLKNPDGTFMVDAKAKAAGCGQ